MTDISIAPYSPTDAEEMHAAVQESVAEVGRWMPWCHPGYSLDDARGWIVLQQDLIRQGLGCDYGIRDAQGRFLGGCGINQVNKANRFANLGYWVRTSAAGRGVAPAAARLVAERTFRETDSIRLEIVCAVGNIKSQRVAEKAGAMREGILRSRIMTPEGPSDAVMYSIIRPSGI